MTWNTFHTELTLSSEVAGTGTERLETRSGGRELQKRENLLYVGIDLHKTLIQLWHMTREKVHLCSVKMMSMIRIVWQRF